MDFINFDSSLFWVLLGVAFLILEALTPGFFLLFFGFGAWVTALTLFFWSDPQGGQWAVFMASSVVSLLILRRKLKSLFNSAPPENELMKDPIVANLYLGREVIVIKDVAPNAPGLIELDGTNWQAKSTDKTFKVGDRAKVLETNGLTLTIIGLDE